MSINPRISFLFLLSILLPWLAYGQDLCVNCHKDVTNGIVSDWSISEHAKKDVGCSSCHGSDHKGIEDVDKVKIPSPETCRMCHPKQVEQFEKGKHALAWKAMEQMPTFHWQPMTLTEGMKGCGGCHKIGIKTDDEIKDTSKGRPGFGVASCDACHTRHVFSEDEAKQPQACATCHMGFDHPQWEMYSTSKHGVRFLLRQNRVLPESTVAPSCQTCHIKDGNHENRTAWGFLAVRLPMAADEQWARDRTTILQALGVLDLEGNPTARFQTIKGLDVCRLTEEEWQRKRDSMVSNCRQCHSVNFVKAELQKGDDMIREADRLMAEAIRIVEGLYRDKIITSPGGKDKSQGFVDLLAFHDVGTPIEQKLFLMFMEYRMRAFQGTFHNNPDYALWYGWSSMQRTLTDIKYSADQMRESAKK